MRKQIKERKKSDDQVRKKEMNMLEIKNKIYEGKKDFREKEYKVM